MWRPSSSLAFALVAAGCGATLPPPAGPPASPPLGATPAGIVVAREEGPPRGRAAATVASPPARAGSSPGRARAAVLDPRGRVLSLAGRRVPAGVGPTHVACLARWCWVTDTRGDALLVFRQAPKLELVRRYYLAGGPYGLALDARHRLLYVTLPGRNQLVQLPATGRPHLLRAWPTVRQPGEVWVDQAGVVHVTGASATALVPPTPAPTPRTAPR